MPIAHGMGGPVAENMKSIDEFIQRLCREAMQQKAETKKAHQPGDTEEEEETLLEDLVKLTDGAPSLLLT